MTADLAISREGDVVTLRPVQPSWTTFLELPKAEDEYLQERSVVMAERSAGRDALPGFVKVVHLNSADATQLQGSALERDAELSADALGSAWARSHPVRIPITASRSTSRRPTPQRSPNSKRCSSALVSALSALSTHTPRYAGSSWRRGWRTWLYTPEWTLSHQSYCSTVIGHVQVATVFLALGR